MEFVQNFPFFSIILSMFAGIVSSVLDGKWAKRVSLCLVTAVIAMSADDSRLDAADRGELHLHDGTFSRTLGK